MVWIHAVTEPTVTTLMNPTSPDKLRRLGNAMELTEGSHLLDIGAGRCGPAVQFAREFGCRVTALEPYEPFLNDARAHAAESGLSDRFEFVQAAGKDFRIEPERYDAAMCLGATWAWDGLDGTIAALAAGVRENGHVAAGEPYRHHPDDTAPQAPHDLTLAEILERFEARGVAVTTLIRSSVDDWDDYQSVRVKNLLDWVRDNPDHDDADDVRRWRREHAIDLAGRHMGWAIVAGRKTRHA